MITFKYGVLGLFLLYLLLCGASPSSWVTYIFFNSEYSYSMMPKLDRMNVYCLYPCEGILKKSDLWQHSDPGWPKEGDNLKFEPCTYYMRWKVPCVSHLGSLFFQLQRAVTPYVSKKENYQAFYLSVSQTYKQYRH